MRENMQLVPRLPGWDVTKRYLRSFTIESCLIGTPVTPQSLLVRFEQMAGTRSSLGSEESPRHSRCAQETRTLSETC